MPLSGGEKKDRPILPRPPVCCSAKTTVPAGAPSLASALTVSFVDCKTGCTSTEKSDLAFKYRAIRSAFTVIIHRYAAVSFWGASSLPPEMPSATVPITYTIIGTTKNIGKYGSSPQVNSTARCPSDRSATET